MLFKTTHLQGIKSGTISLAFRYWEKPTVKAGTLLKTAIGLVEISSITAMTAPDLTEEDARLAGYDTKKQLLGVLRKYPNGNLYRISVRYHSEDPRHALREQRLTDDRFKELNEKLARLDRYSKAGHWTQNVLNTIAMHPHRRAVEIAELTGFEKEWLKTNIRKLKNLGLTISHDIGYELAPLGQAYLGRIDDE